MGREWQLSLVGVIAYIAMLMKVDDFISSVNFKGRNVWRPNCAGAEIPEG